jgi:hypothetical protein
MEENVEERLQRISALNKQAREEQQKKREVSATKRAEAIEACRKINMELAAENAAKGKGKSKAGAGGAGAGADKVILQSFYGI